MNLFDIYKGKKVLITGHTGFKGSWLAIWLNSIGAKVIGFSLPEWDNDYIFKNSKLKDLIINETGDVRDLNKLKEIFLKHKPEIIFHLAAQPIVRKSYTNPIETLSTNIMGTVNILECIKEFDFVKAAVIITTDKCYKNKEQTEGYKEDDELGGYDPYSASKACAEIIINSYRNSFFNNQNKLVASARAGNIIGGGDFGEDRLIPDCINALNQNNDIKIRNPNAIRPWQHVLEPLNGYLLLGEKLLQEKKEFAEAWNFAPNFNSMVPVIEIINLVTEKWGNGKWVDISNSNEKKHETKLLYLDNTKAKDLLEWDPKLDIKQTIEYTVDWYKRSYNEDIYNLCLEQIKSFIGS